MLSVLDIQKQEFRKAFNGYSMKDVDDFLSIVAETVEVLYNDVDDLKDKVDRLTFEIEKYKKMEETMAQTILFAKVTSEDIIHNAKVEADNIIDRANTNALEIKQKTELEINDLLVKKMGIQNELVSFKTRVESILKSQLATIREIDVPQLQKTENENEVE